MDKPVADFEATPRPATTLPPRTRRRRPLHLLLVLLALVAAAALLWWHPWSGSTRAPPPPPPQAVTVATASRGDIPIVVTALGTVTPLATVTVQTQINGQLIDVGFREGQEVRRGDFLAQIDPRPYQAALTQAQGALARDQALLANARLDLIRFRTLNRQDSIARQQVDTQASLVHQYEGTITADQGGVATQQLNLTYCHITAPVDGRVGLRLIDPGNYVQTSSTTGLLVITRLRPISVIFTVPEDAIPQIARRLAAGATLQASAYDRAGTALIATGTLQTVDNQIDTTTGTVKIRATFANQDEQLFPNQFVNIQLLVDTLRGAVLVPNAAIQRGAPGTFVFLAGADGTVSIRPVKIGPGDARNTAVAEGLAPGDRVVTDGTDRLREGTTISVQSGKQATPGAPTAPAAPHHRRRPE